MRRLHMGVKLREKPKGSGIWWVFVNDNRRRTSRKIGTKKAAEKVLPVIQAQLTLGQFWSGSDGDTAMARGSIVTRTQKDGTKRYNAIIRINGKQQWKTFDRKKDAEEYLDQQSTAIRKGVQPIHYGYPQAPTRGIVEVPPYPAKEGSIPAASG